MKVKLALLAFFLIALLLVAYLTSVIGLFVLGLLFVIICVAFIVLYNVVQKVSSDSHQWEKVISMTCGIVGVLTALLSLGMFFRFL